MSSPDKEHGSVGHIVPIKLLVGTCAALLFLTAVTVWVSKLDFVELRMGEMNILVAMGVAVVKCTVVALIFMHLRWDRSFIGFIFVGSILFVGVFIGFALLDTSEYQPSMIPGDTPQVQMKLDALEASAAAGAEGDHGTSGEH
ncbi:MAG: caa(3)-type oxidase subunit IV [Planctomycetes bacterium]|nr:caa(3)-type oxidase subunit IV [Planctomycetota bacterium]MCP4837875.1 caa(3)-type oxidase subunit IV [Planctomycetota bacterium]